MDNANTTDSPPEFGHLLARAYSRHWNDHSRAMVGNLKKIATRFGFAYRRVADLACGEGTFALGVARDGHEVIGIDLSADMLQIARKQESDIRRRGVPLDGTVTWLRQDMRELSLPQPVDVVTCWYNSLNYLTEQDDLRMAFRAVRNALVPGGMFLFDVYTTTGLSVEWTDKVWIAVDTEECFVTSRTRYHEAERLATVHFTGFVRNGDEYARFDETHHNRGYERRVIEMMLRDEGLEHISTFTLPRMMKPERDAHRLVMLARRTDIC
jgi:SAM-dependent methyltransferase